MFQISGASQPLSSKCLLQGVFLLHLRVTYTAEQVSSLPQWEASFPSQAIFLKRRARLRPLVPEKWTLIYPVCGSWAWLSAALVGTARLCMASVPHSPLLSLRPKEKLAGGWGGNRTIRAVCLCHHPNPSWFSHKGSPCCLIFYLGVRMAGPPRGHAWPWGRCLSPQFIIITLRICLVGSSTLEVPLEVYHP